MFQSPAQTLVFIPLPEVSCDFTFRFLMIKYYKLFIFLLPGLSNREWNKKNFPDRQKQQSWTNTLFFNNFSKHLSGLHMHHSYNGIAIKGSFLRNKQAVYCQGKGISH